MLALGGAFALVAPHRAPDARAGRSSTRMTYNRIFTMHGIVMVWLFMIPSIPAAFGNFLLPIMIGAKDVAFPRLNLLSYYIYRLRRALGPRRRSGSAACDTGLDVLHALQRALAERGRPDGLRHLHPRVVDDHHRASTSSSRRTRCAPRASAGSGCRSSSGRSTATSIIQVLATPVLAHVARASSASTTGSTGASSTRRAAATRCSTSTSSGSTRTRRSTS